MFVRCECCVSPGRGLCDELITRPEESYWLWCVAVCDLETSRMRRPWPALGRSATKKKVVMSARVLILDLLHQGVGVWGGSAQKKFGTKSVDDNWDGLNVQSVVQVGCGSASDNYRRFRDIRTGYFWVWHKNTLHTAKSNAAIYHTLQTRAGVRRNYNAAPHTTCMLHILWHTYFVRKFLQCRVNTVNANLCVRMAPKLRLVLGPEMFSIGTRDYNVTYVRRVQCKRWWLSSTPSRPKLFSALTEHPRFDSWQRQFLRQNV